MGICWPSDHVPDARVTMKKKSYSLVFGGIWCDIKGRDLEKLFQCNMAEAVRIYAHNAIKVKKSVL